MIFWENPMYLSGGVNPKIKMPRTTNPAKLDHPSIGINLEFSAGLNFFNQVNMKWEKIVYPAWTVWFAEGENPGCSVPFFFAATQ